MVAIMLKAWATSSTLLEKWSNRPCPSAPEYEWYPRTTLTAEQIRAMELRQVLSRRKEATDREVIGRVTNEEQEKELAKAVREIERKKLAQYIYY